MESEPGFDIEQGEIEAKKPKRIWDVREIARNVVTLCALLLAIIIMFDKHADENYLQNQLEDFREDRIAADKLVADKNECNKRYQTILDYNTEQQLILMGEFLVVITLTPPGDDRVKAVENKVRELDIINIAARESAKAKNNYHNSGEPLPCPIPEPGPPPPLDPVDPGVTLP